MGLLSKAGMGPQMARPQAPMQGQVQPSMQGQNPDPMAQIIDMLRQNGVPVDQMPPQQVQAMVMQIMQGAQR